MKKYNIDSYFNMEGSLEITTWRTMHPLVLCETINKIIRNRIELL